MREWTKYATDVQLDKQNRIHISKELLELAKLKKDVIFQGANDRVEIWDPQVQEEYTRRFEKEQSITFEDIAEIFDWDSRLLNQLVKLSFCFSGIQAVIHFDLIYFCYFS